MWHSCSWPWAAWVARRLPRSLTWPATRHRVSARGWVFSRVQAGQRQGSGPTPPRGPSPGSLVWRAGGAARWRRGSVPALLSGRQTARGEEQLGSGGQVVRIRHSGRSLLPCYGWPEGQDVATPCQPLLCRGGGASGLHSPTCGALQASGTVMTSRAGHQPSRAAQSHWAGVTGSAGARGWPAAALLRA